MAVDTRCNGIMTSMENLLHIVQYLLVLLIYYQHHLDMLKLVHVHQELIEVIVYHHQKASHKHIQIIPDHLYLY